MKAAVVTKDHRVSIEEKRLRIETWRSISKTEYCGVCHTDLHVKMQISVTLQV